jgi:hypothetical protein
LKDGSYLKFLRLPKKPTAYKTNPRPIAVMRMSIRVNELLKTKFLMKYPEANNTIRNIK